MFPGIWRLKSKGILIVALLLTVVNAYWIQSPILGTLTLLGVIIPTGELAGPFFLKDQPRWMQTVTGVMSVIALISILGSLLYYLGPVSKTSFVVLMVLVSIASAMVGGKATTGSKRGSLAFPSPTMILTLTAIIIALAAWWTAIAPVRITEAVRTPWDFVDPFAVVAIGIATLLLFGLSHVSKGRTLLIPLVAATFFSAIAMALAIYPLGFGFDSFIHRATVSHIVAFGTITPKPFYYIGQYALELMAVHAFALPLQLVDRLLVPLLAAFFISASAAIGFFLRGLA
ncbi:hypothetical protein IH979_02830, partial [Patescibacteria group bacterium]|nr:hypothetical protein [Patescibacteria group bacterium]